MLRALLVMPLLLVLLSTGLSAAESKLSPDAQKAEAEHEARVAKIMQSAQDDIEKKKADLKKALDKELKSVMRDGDLDKATAIKKMIEDIDKEDPLYEAFGKQALLAKKADKQDMAKKYRIKIIAAVVQVPMSMQRHYVQKTVQKHVDGGDYEINPAALVGEETGVKMGRLHLSYTINGGKNIVKEIGWYRTESLIPEEEE